MKLAYISTEYPPLVYGGLGVYVQYIFHELNAMGQKISVFTWGDGQIGKYGNDEGIEVIRETPVPLKDGVEKAAEKTLAIYEEALSSRS
jgi:glycogen(starch) synthase